MKSLASDQPLTPELSSQEAQEEESYRYAFVIERRYDLDSVPKPIDERINLRMT